MMINDYVKPITIPPKQNDEWMEEGTPVRVCGWGDIQYVPGAVFPDELYCVNSEVVSNEKCNDRLSYNGRIAHGMFCIGDYDEGGKHACALDSGGPATLLSDQTDYFDEDVIVGI